MKSADALAVSFEKYFAVDFADPLLLVVPSRIVDYDILDCPILARTRIHCACLLNPFHDIFIINRTI